MSSFNSTTGSITITPQDTEYGYFVSESAAIFFVIFYAISFVIHLAQAVHFRIWWLLPTACLAGLGETIGWSGRLIGSINPFNTSSFLIQIVALVLSPTLLVAAIFVIFGRLVAQLGTSYSRLRPQLYSTLFVPCDILSLIVQSVGGGTAANATTESGLRLGCNIMLGGIVFQLASFIIYMILAAEYFIRHYRDSPVRWSQSSEPADRILMDTRLKLMTAGLVLASICILIRSIYRCAELGDGWSGPIMRTEVYFNLFDGAIILLAMYTFNVCHPGFLLDNTPPYKPGTGVDKKSPASGSSF